MIQDHVLLPTDIERELSSHASKRARGISIISVCGELTAQVRTQLDGLYGQVTVWDEHATSSNQSLEKHMLALASSRWSEVLVARAWERLALRANATAEAFKIRYLEMGEALREALVQRVTLDDIDAIARSLVEVSPDRLESAIQAVFERLGLVQAWSKLARLTSPPAVLLRLSPAGNELPLGLPLLIRAVECTPSWSVTIAADECWARGLLAGTDSHERAFLRSGLLMSTGSKVAQEISPFVPARQAIESLGLPNDAPGVACTQAGATTGEEAQRAGDARSLAEAALFWLLNQHPETRDLFALNVRMSFTFGSRPAELDLFSESLALCIEVDGPHHFIGADAYRRDRRKDALLQRNGICVIRFLAEDVVRQQQEVLNQVLEMVRARRKI